MHVILYNYYIYCELRQQGVGTKIRRVAVISCQDENKLWSTSVIGTETPLSLHRAVFFFAKIEPEYIPCVILIIIDLFTTSCVI